MSAGVSGNDHLHSQHIYCWQSAHSAHRCQSVFYSLLCFALTLSSVKQLSSQPCIPPSMLSMLTALHALFTAKLKYRAESESCMLRQLNRGGAVTTAESVCHRVITFFFFPIVPRQCSCLNERD